MPYDLSYPAIANKPISGSPVRTVNARDLHAFLGVGKTFAAWIVSRIDQYGFAEDVDFVRDSRSPKLASGGCDAVSAETGENPSSEVFSSFGKNLGGRPATEYFLSLDMAKELSMVERTEKGRQARRYFIECERRAFAAPTTGSHVTATEDAVAKALQRAAAAAVGGAASVADVLLFLGDRLPPLNMETVRTHLRNLEAKGVVCRPRHGLWQPAASPPECARVEKSKKFCTGDDVLKVKTYYGQDLDPRIEMVVDIGDLGLAADVLKILSGRMQGR